MLFQDVKVVDLEFYDLTVEQQSNIVTLELDSGTTHLVRAVRYSTVQYSTVQYSTVQYSTVQYSTVQYSTVQYSTVQYSTVQYSTVQYNNTLFITVRGIALSFRRALGITCKMLT